MTAPYSQTIVTKLLHVDLGSGSVSEWFDSKGLRVMPLALDSSGAALVMASNSVVIEIWRVSGPGDATRIYSAGASSNAIQPAGDAVTDGDRVWLGSNQGLIQYSQADGLKVVSKATGHPGGQCH